MRKLLFVLLLLAAAGGGALYYVVFAPNTRALGDAPASVFIPPGATYEAALDSLDARVLRSRATFDLVATTTPWGDQIKAGHYLIPEGFSNRDILDKLRRGLRDPVRITIPPGSTPPTVAAVMARDFLFEPDTLLALWRDPAFAAELGTDTTHLFGMMMPETYEVYWTASPRSIVRKVKESFDAFYERELAAAARRSELEKDEVLSLASIVEWESWVHEERPRVAGVYYNRLKRGMKLDADPTVQYGLIEIEGQKRRLLFRDYRLEHPYNTYLRPGLPPGPITNPAPSALRAAASPESHDYLYFVASADGDGSHVFSRNLREHNRAAAQYRRALRERQAAQANGDAGR